MGRCAVQRDGEQSAYVFPCRRRRNRPVGERVWRGSTQLSRRRATRTIHIQELAHVARWTSLGELTASIANEINQPLTAVVINASTTSRWLNADPPRR